MNATDTKPPTTTIYVLKSTQQKLDALRDKHGKFMYSMVETWARLWEIAPEDLRRQALEWEPEVDTNPSALGDADANDPRRESIKLSCRASKLVEKIDRSLSNDGKIDNRELREVIDEVKAITHQGERVGHASKRVARRKGRAA